MVALRFLVPSVGVQIPVSLPLLNLSAFHTPEVFLSLEFFGDIDESMVMNRAELAATVDELSEDERSYLSAYLKMKERMCDATFANEMTSRLKAMQSGHEVQRDQVLDIHGRLSENGL